MSRQTNTFKFLSDLNWELCLTWTYNGDRTLDLFYIKAHEMQKHYNRSKAEDRKQISVDSAGRILVQKIIHCPLMT